MVRMQNSERRILGAEKAGSGGLRFGTLYNPKLGFSGSPSWVPKGSRAALVGALMDFVGLVASIEGAVGEQGAAAQRSLEWLVHCPTAGVSLAKALRPHLCDVVVILLKLICWPRNFKIDLLVC